jgi:signal peptidase I
MSHAPARTEKHPMRTLVHGIGMVLLGAIFLQTFLLDGLFVPYRVVGGSMAATLLGLHRVVTCGQCRFQFDCGADASPMARRAPCPNCGYVENDLGALPDVDGDRVLIDKTALEIRPPRRWEVVALRHPVEAGRSLVKRVVALPGESIWIQGGDVYINGQIERKNLDQQHALSVLVHDADFEPPRPAEQRWRPERTDSHWNEQSGQFTLPVGANEQISDWLAYHQAPVTDFCAYNASHTRREEDIHAVADLRLAFHISFSSGRDICFVRATDGGEVFEVRLTAESIHPHPGPLPAGEGMDVEVRHNGERVPSTKSTRPHLNPLSEGAGTDLISVAAVERIIEVSLVDQQFLLAVDGQTLATVVYERRRPFVPPACPFAIGGQSGPISISQLRVYRDVYYGRPTGVTLRPGLDGPLRLAEGEFYVLGDNPKVSDDSRSWPNHGAIDTKLLIGRPLAAMPYIFFVPWEGRRFQVPNPIRIRYIE